MTQELIQRWLTSPAGRTEGEGLYLGEMRSKRLLQAAGIRVADTIVLPDTEEVVRASRALGYPLQVTAITEERIPDSVAPNVSMTVGSEANARRSCEEILVYIKQWNPGCKVEGFTLREAPQNSVELRMTIEQDPVLGRIMAVGYGRTAMEIYGDVAYRVIPLSKRDPHVMLDELKGTRMVAGYRNLDKTNISYIEEMIIRVSDFVERTPEIYRMELDPLYSTRRRLSVYDARIELRLLDGH